MKQLDTPSLNAQKSDTPDDSLAWFTEARFGMFVHWGLYSAPAGVWKGKEYPGIGEWIAHWASIDTRDYEEIASTFNPVRFDAEAWAQLAKEAGMKYLVITAKHADGFAMYQSQCSKYNIVDATPFKRDPVKELAVACKRNGIKLCVYYSQAVDLHDPDAQKHWEYETEDKRDFGKYWRNKLKPQLKELLTQYGEIGLIWFDNPTGMSKRQSLELKRFVKSFQPDCLVSGRIGSGVGDYESCGDNQAPSASVRVVETPFTMNDTWGYKANDHNWKSFREILTGLIELASKGGNCLLNVGPTALGIIPKASVSRLRMMGRWMSSNGESIYGTNASPYPFEFDWGRMTSKPGKLYLFFMKWPRSRFYLNGLRNKVKKVYLLSDKKTRIGFEQTVDETLHISRLDLDLPKRKPDQEIPVVVLDIDGKPRIDDGFYAQYRDIVTLPAGSATPRRARGKSSITVSPAGVTMDWKSSEDWLEWKTTLEAGTYLIKAKTENPVHGQDWIGGHRVRVALSDTEIRSSLKADEVPGSVNTRYYGQAVSAVGKVTIATAGEYTLKLLVEKLNSKAPHGLNLSEISLLKQ